ncbi:MAG TPA: thiamine phosphate synthase [Orrella sp.]
MYGVTPDWDDNAKLVAAVEAAAAGGMRALQLRHKSASAKQRLELAQTLLPICRRWQIPLIINDDWQLALTVDADGVHLGKDDDDPAHVRAEIGHDKVLGVSCYSDLDRAQQMLEIGVDYVAFGAMFASGTKPQATSAALSTIADACALTEQIAPQAGVVAIGGITVDNAASVLAAGARSLAVVGGLFNTHDIQTTARAFSALMTPPGTDNTGGASIEAGEPNDH